MINTHKRAAFATLHGALLDIVAVMNEPRRDERLIAEAGITLDRALFPLVVLIDRCGPIGVVGLADRVGRDYSTVSRQVAKLEHLGLVARAPAASDRRVNEAVVTPAGKAMNDAIDRARERIAGEVLRGWEDRDFRELVKLMRRLADDLIR